MPTENRSSNTEQMVSVPRELVDAALADLPSDSQLGFELRALLTQPAAQHQGEQFTYSSKQATNCAGCGIRKHTPLRVDEMGGYVCLTCIDQKLESLLSPQEHHCEPVAWASRPLLGSQKGKLFLVKGPGYFASNLDLYEKPFPLYTHPPVQSQGEPVAYWVIDEFGQKKVVLPGAETVARGKARGYAMRPLYFHPPTSDGFSGGDMADQGAKAFDARDPEVQELRAKLAEAQEVLRDCIEVGELDAETQWKAERVSKGRRLYVDDRALASIAEPSAPVESDQGIPGTSFQRLNMLANQGE